MQTDEFTGFSNYVHLIVLVKIPGKKVGGTLFVPQKTTTQGMKHLDWEMKQLRYFNKLILANVVYLLHIILLYYYNGPFSWFSCLPLFFLNSIF